MKILIKANDTSISERAKGLLESFGKGMHIYTRDDGISLYGCVICIGATTDFSQPELFLTVAEPKTEDDWGDTEKALWNFYRDNLKDVFSGRCSCGLFEYCHCH
ncbi:MAG: hypothetical protein HUK08_02500 [Bacteroidaceae bacterium]|nr:hypothetical protein [Bacteroidaceae bacterium]